jgi:hypothetical protein
MLLDLATTRPSRDPDVLSGVDALDSDRHVCRRDRQVYDNLDRWVLQHACGRPGDGDAVLVRLLLRPAFVDVTESDDVQVGKAGEIIEVEIANHAGAYQADANGPAFATQANLSR